MSNHKSNNYNHSDGHNHTHGAVDPHIITIERGIGAVKWSLIVLLPTAIFQLIILFTGSVALFAILSII